MKLRNGFVSNSSSSSFVAIGFFLTQEEQEAVEEGLYKTIEDNGLYFYFGDEGGLKRGEVAIGKEIYTVRSEDMGITESRFSLSEINNEIIKEASKVKEFLKEQGVELTSEPKLFSGTRSS